MRQRSNHPAAECFPMHDPQRLAELAEDIGRNGLLDPIVLCDGLLLDGRLIEVAPTEQFFESPSDPRTADFIQGKMVY